MNVKNILRLDWYLKMSSSVLNHSNIKCVLNQDIWFYFKSFVKTIILSYSAFQRNDTELSYLDSQDLTRHLAEFLLRYFLMKFGSHNYVYVFEKKGSSGSAINPQLFKKNSESL